DAWGASTGEALHTQTFLGHPVGCAAALAVLDLLEGGVLDQVRACGDRLRGGLEARGLGVRGRGLLLAVETGRPSLAVARALLRRGYLVLPADERSLTLSPPACLTADQAAAFTTALCDVLEEGA